jgi:hypothetical protein
MTVSAGVVQRDDGHRRDHRHISTAQQRWPTFGWALGELRWYAIGGAVGAGVFVSWVGITAARMLSF